MRSLAAGNLEFGIGLGKSWGQAVHNLCATFVELPSCSTWLLGVFWGVVAKALFIRRFLNTQSMHLSPSANHHFPDASCYFSPLSTPPINTPTHEKKEFYFIKHGAKPRQSTWQLPTHNFLIPTNA